MPLKRAPSSWTLGLESINKDLKPLVNLSGPLGILNHSHVMRVSLRQAL
jgi:hypothetical protein